MSYVEVVSSGDSMTMIIEIFEKQRSMIKTLMLIFTNSNDNYIIHDLDDNIPRVCYRNRPKGWMDKNSFWKIYFESRAF